MRFVGGKDGKVYVVGAQISGRFEPYKYLGEFEWGKKPATPRCIDLAKQMLSLVIPGDQVRVTKLYLGFMHHTLTQGLKPGIAWTLTDEDVLKALAEIEQNRREGAQLIAASRNEVPRVQMAGPQFPGKTGYGSNDSAPDRKR